METILIKFIMEWTAMETESVGLIGPSLFKSILTFFILPAVSLYLTNVADEILKPNAKMNYLCLWIH